MAERTIQIYTDKDIQDAIEVIEKSSSSPLVRKTVDVDITNTPTIDNVARQSVMMKCGIEREFPNSQLATLLGDKYAALIDRQLEDSQKTLDNVNFAASIDQYLWAAVGVVANMIVTAVTGGTGTALAGAAVSFLAKMSTASVDEWVVRLEEQLAAGAADPEMINQIALIAGDPTAISVVVQAVDQIPQNELPSYLDNVISQYRMYRDVVIPAYPAFIFDNSVKLQIKMYSALAVTAYTIQIVCDRLLQDNTPLVPTQSSVSVALAPSGSSLPSESEGTVRGDGTGTDDKKGGGGTLALLALLGLGVYALV